MTSPAITDLELPLRLHNRGKVRDSYELPENRLLMVATDRISAFDHVLPTGIPDRGRVLTGLSLFWSHRITIPDHVISHDISSLDLPDKDKAKLEGRSMIVHHCIPIPIECVVRGYLAGSGWKEYQESGTVCGLQLPKGLVESSFLPQPIFTPATKAAPGEHDENISFEQMRNRLAWWAGDDDSGFALADSLRDKSIELYTFGREHGERKEIIIADTKFEFGLTTDGKILLIDEVLTPDSSRFWDLARYEHGKSQPSFDKQYVRDWLANEAGWDKNSPPPPLPDEVVANTREKYIVAYQRLVGSDFPWK